LAKPETYVAASFMVFSKTHDSGVGSILYELITGLFRPTLVEWDISFIAALALLMGIELPLLSA
jgi:hypothetical protein